jgi:serine protease
MATPHVSAAAALLISANAAKTPDAIRKVLTKSAKNLGTAGFDRTFGHGLLQVYSALTMDTSSSTPSPTPSDVGRNRTAKCSAFKSTRKCRKQASCKRLSVETKKVSNEELIVFYRSNTCQSNWQTT